MKLNRNYLFRIFYLLSSCIIGASRQRKNWNEIKNESTSSFEKIATPNSSDYDILASSILDFIELVMDLEEKKKFPSFETARSLMEDKEKMNYYMSFPSDLSTHNFISNKIDKIIERSEILN